MAEMTPTSVIPSASATRPPRGPPRLTKRHLRLWRRDRRVVLLRHGGRAHGSVRPQVFGGALYEEADVDGATDTAVQASLGCGVPTAVADLHEGETVLDLGSGARCGRADLARGGWDRRGKAIGLDMTDEMLELARANARETGVPNVEFVKGYIEELPLPDASVDVIISNCVINLSADKQRVIAGGRARAPPGRALRRLRRDRRRGHGRGDAPRHVGLDRLHRRARSRGASSRDALMAAGLGEIEIRETHRVHEHAGSAIIRARKPLTPAQR